ncbi:MAG: helix-turn-helix domain-containing protein [Euryarchaeota archaeon]|nr:helix-turn-helix domain-containing protein [Euryarchaeota archaeon]
MLSGQRTFSQKRGSSLSICGGDHLKVLKITDKEEVINEIEKGIEEEIVYLSVRPSIDIVVALLENAPNLNTILCPPSLYTLTSERVKKALRKVGISLKKGSFNVGRPKKYTEDDIDKMLDLRNAGSSVIEISEELGIPRRTIYYYLNKVKNNEI